MRKLILVALVIACNGSKKTETVLDSGHVSKADTSSVCKRARPKPVSADPTVEFDTSCILVDTLPEN